MLLFFLLLILRLLASDIAQSAIYSRSIGRQFQVGLAAQILYIRSDCSLSIISYLSDGNANDDDLKLLLRRMRYPTILSSVKNADGSAIRVLTKPKSNQIDALQKQD